MSVYAEGGPKKERPQGTRNGQRRMYVGKESMSTTNVMCLSTRHDRVRSSHPRSILDLCSRQNSGPRSTETTTRAATRAILSIKAERGSQPAHDKESSDSLPIPTKPAAAAAVVVRHTHTRTHTPASDRRKKGRGHRVRVRRSVHERRVIPNPLDHGGQWQRERRRAPTPLQGGDPRPPTTPHRHIAINTQGHRGGGGGVGQGSRWIGKGKSSGVGSRGRRSEG